MTQYYTKDEVDELLTSKSPASHTHTNYEQQIAEINQLLDDLENEVLS